jgi:hypothetical protein
MWATNPDTPSPRPLTPKSGEAEWGLWVTSHTNTW